VKLSAKEKALFIVSLMCAFHLTYAQSADTTSSEEPPIADTVSAQEQSAEDTPYQYTRILHIEPPISLAKIENSEPMSFSAQFATAAELPIEPKTKGFSDLSPAQRAYLGRLEEIGDFDQVLEDLEIEGGAWSVQIAEELAELGELLQAQGKFAESIDVLDRAVHINRVNNGLFSTNQVPLIEKVVDAHKALGQWSEADDRQQYAFYVQTRAYSIGDPRMIDVFDNLARWNIATFYRGIDEDPSPRLFQTYMLYRAATESVATHFGTQDPRYLPLLHKAASAADLMGRYTAQGSAIGTHMNPDLRMTSRFVGGSMGPQGRNDAGVEALEAIVAYYNDPKLPQTDEILVERTRALAGLGDWYLLRDRRQAAIRTYEEAYEQLAAAENSEDLLSQVFDEIVFLPTFSEFDEQRKEANGVGPDSGARMGYVDLAFDVNQYGRLSNFEVLAIQPEELTRADIQVISSMRSTLVRPRIDEDGPMSSDLERYRFNFWY
jgi:tetratricopeptide (TPR) repeat protein